MAQAESIIVGVSPASVSAGTFPGAAYVFAGTLTVQGVLTVALGGGSGAVSVGAADSGGVGFRLLRVPN